MSVLAVVCKWMQQLLTMLTHLQFIVGKIRPIRLQHCCATLRRSRNKRNVGSCWLKSLTGFKLCATTSNNMQQGVQSNATCNIQQCWELLANILLRPFARGFTPNNVASLCTGLYFRKDKNSIILSPSGAFQG